jgi:hypothetical protein
MLSALAKVVPGVTVLATAPVGWNASKSEVSADTVTDSFPRTVVYISSKLKCHESCVADPCSRESDSNPLPSVKRLCDRMAARETIGLSSRCRRRRRRRSPPSRSNDWSLWFGSYYCLRVGELSGLRAMVLGTRVDSVTQQMPPTSRRDQFCVCIGMD